MQKAMFVFVCALILKVAVAAGADSEVSGAVVGDANSVPVLLLAENDADFFTENATVSDASQAVPSVSATATTPTEAAPAVKAETIKAESAPISQTQSVPSIHNNITVTPTAPRESVQAAEAAAVLGLKAKEDENKDTRMSLIPMVGGSKYSGRWGDHILNSYNFGVALEMPFSRIFAVEAEADYSKNHVSYGDNQRAFAHDFYVYSFGGNGKLYLLRQHIRPYLGAGLLGNYYQNMSHGPTYPDRYSEIIGSSQLLVGSDFEVADDLALGLRAAWISPLFNRAQTVHNGQNAYPYYEEAAAMDTAFYRIMATAKITF